MTIANVGAQLTVAFPEADDEVQVAIVYLAGEVQALLSPAVEDEPDSGAGRGADHYELDDEG